MTVEKMKAFCLCLLAAVLTSACVSCFFQFTPKVWVETEQDFELPAAGLESLNVKTHNGNIVLTGSAEAESLSVHAVTRAGGRDQADAERCLNAVRLRTSVSGTEQELGVEWIEEKERTWQVCVSFEVILPARLSVTGVSHNGNVTAASLESAGDLETHNGNVTATGHRGTLSVETHNGDITAEASAPSLSLTTHNGRISVEAETGELHCSTHNGGVSGELTGTGPLSGKISSYNGEIRFVLGSGLSATINCRTHNGRIRVNRMMERTVEKKHLLKGTIGDGRGNLELSTHNGSVTLD